MVPRSHLYAISHQPYANYEIRGGGGEAMTSETILIESNDQITTITLTRPKSKNAMNPQMHFDMCDALAGVERDDDCRVLVLTGAGDGFCAGMDVKEYFYDTEGKPDARAAARKAAF